MIKGTLFYLATLVLGSRIQRKREPDRIPRLRYFGAAFMMGLWSFLWFDLCVIHYSAYQTYTWLGYIDPLYGYPHNWQVPLLMGVLSFFCIFLFSCWTVSLEEDRIVVRRWPFPAKGIELSKLRAVERYRTKNHGAILYFKGEPDFKIDSFMSGQSYFLEALDQYLTERRSRMKNGAISGRTGNST